MHIINHLRSTHDDRRNVARLDIQDIWKLPLEDNTNPQLFLLVN